MRQQEIVAPHAVSSNDYLLADEYCKVICSADKYCKAICDPACDLPEA
jgi:hypothetical protein